MAVVDVGARVVAEGDQQLHPLTGHHQHGVFPALVHIAVLDALPAGAQLRQHLAAGSRATHYGWETSADPAAREAELMSEFVRRHGRRPRDNAA